MKAQHLDERWAAVLVVARVVDVLQASRRRYAAPEMRGVVRFEDVLATITQRPVSKQKPLAALRQILAVRCGQTVGHDSNSEPVVRSMPRQAAHVPAGLLA